MIKLEGSSKKTLRLKAFSEHTMPTVSCLGSCPTRVMGIWKFPNAQADRFAGETFMLTQDPANDADNEAVNVNSLSFPSRPLIGHIQRTAENGPAFVARHVARLLVVVPAATGHVKLHASLEEPYELNSRRLNPLRVHFLTDLPIGHGVVGEVTAYLANVGLHQNPVRAHARIDLDQLWPLLPALIAVDVANSESE